MNDEADVVIVGAGPAGGAAAYHLARRGHRVILLERSAFPRDKSCGDAVNRAGVRLLAEMDVLSVLTGPWAIGGMHIRLGPAGSRSTRDFRYGRTDPVSGRYGLVIPRAVLDEAIVARAVAMGAQFRARVQARELIRQNGLVRGVRTAGGAVHAKVVVAADGSTSRLARQSGLVQPSHGRLGYAMRTYFSGLAELDDNLWFTMPLGGSTGSRLPAYGWVIPLGPGRANVGAGLAEKHPGTNLNQLFTEFVEELRATMPWFATATQEGPARGAPLFFGFSPNRSWAPGLILAGDAAGMVNPGTGEGISFALESGKIAAEVIDAQLGAGRPGDLSGYSATLTRRFSGHLETGRHAVTRHRLAWRVLEDTFDSDRPVFALTRRAMLAPDHSAGFETTVPGEVDDIRHCLDPRLRLAAPLVEIGEILSDTVRMDWPFLDRLPALLSDEYLMAPRPALLVLLAARFGAGGPDQVTSLAAATDLAGLAAIAQASVDIAPSTGPREGLPNWGTMFAVLTTDLFLARALQLCATRDARLTGELALAIEEACIGRMRELTAARQSPAPTPRAWLKLSSRSGTAALCAAACELGASATGAEAGVMKALGAYGRAVGTAAQLADDVRRLSGGLDRLGRDALADLEAERDGGLSSIPFRLALAEADLSVPGDGSRQERAAELTRLVAKTNALRHTHAWIGELCRQAQQDLTALPDGPAKSTLHAIAQHLIRSTPSPLTPEPAHPSPESRPAAPD